MSIQKEEPVSNKDRLETLQQKIHAYRDDDEQYLRLLHETFEFIEHMSLNGSQDELTQQFNSTILPMIIDRAQQTEVQFIDNTRHKIRRQTMEIIQLIPYPNDKNQLPLAKIIELLITVLEKDNEENAEMSIKMLYEAQKFYRPFYTLNELQDGNERFLSYCLEVINGLPARLEECKQTPEESMRGLTQDDSSQGLGQRQQATKNLLPSKNSMKTINHFISYYIWISNSFEGTPVNIMRFFTAIMGVFEKFPSDTLKSVKNMLLYIEYLESLKICMNFFNFMFKRMPKMAQQMTDYFIEKFTQIFAAQILILKNMPQVGTQNLRKEILSLIKIEINDVTTLEKQDKEQMAKGVRISRVDKNLYHKKDLGLKALIDDVLKGDSLTGRGNVSKDINVLSRQIQFTFIYQIREHMTIEQLRDSMSLLIRCLFDRKLSLQIRGQSFHCMFKIFDDLKKKNIDSLNQVCDIFESLTLFYKDLDGQIKILADEFTTIKADIAAIKKEPRIRWMNDNEQKNTEIRDLLMSDSGVPFVDLSKDKTQPPEAFDLDKALQDYQFYHIHDNSVDQIQSDVTRLKETKYAWLLQMSDSQLNDHIEQLKEHCCTRMVKNLIQFIETMILAIIEKQQNNYFQVREMRSLRRLFIHGSNVVQHIADMIQTTSSGQSGISQSNIERDKVDNVKKMGKIFTEMQPLQYRDLISSVEDEFFGRIIEVKATKGDSGIVSFADHMMSLSNQPQNQPNVKPYQHLLKFDGIILELFFSFIVKKMRIFNKAMEGETLLSNSKLDQRLAKIPTPDLQDTIQKLALMIGEKALSKKSDQRMKNLFFSVFIFCIKFTKASKIVPYYFQVIRNLFKMLNNLNDNTQFVKEFVPMIQGLLETFLQAKEEAAFIKETNEICYSVPAKLKNLIEYLPIVSRPLIDSMKLTQVDVIENGITTIQMWVSALTSYPEILDPVIDGILPELNSLLYKFFCILPHQTFKLLGKLGSKTRLYFEEKELRAKNFPEEGLKIDLEDKSTGREVVLPLDSCIGTILIKVFDCFHKYPQDKLLQTYKLVKNSFLCFIEPNIDVDFLVTSIINVRSKNNELLTQYAKISSKYFDSRRTQTKINNMSRGQESHGFEKILKSLLIASSIPKNNPDTSVIHRKVKRFFKWVSQYFTLIYICKNGKLMENLPDEISPLIFFDNICEFLYFNVQQSSAKTQQRSYLKGSIRAIKIMLRTVKAIYAEDEWSEVFESLEFIQILIHKLCHIAYGSDLPNKVAMNIALQIVIKELPSTTVKKNFNSFIDALFHILNISNEQLIHQVEQESRKTLDILFEKVGIYSKELLAQVDEREFQNQVLDKLISQLLHNKAPTRVIAIYFIEKISRLSGLSVAIIFQKVLRPQQPQQPPESLERSWSAHFQVYIEQKSRILFNLFKNGYTQVLCLIQILDLIQFLLKHHVVQPIQNKAHTYILICDQLLKILEEEVQKFDQQTEMQQNAQNLNDMSTSNASKSAVKYMKLEKHYMSQNKVHDPYSHTLHPHHFLQNQHFEIEEQAKRDRLQAEQNDVQYCHMSYQMFQQRLPNLNPSTEPQALFFEEIQRGDLDGMMKGVNLRINDFIKKMFASSIRASDISYDYIHHMYELYPNHRLHAEMIAKCLQVLCDITTEDNMHKFLKERQQIYFDQMQNYQVSQTLYHEAKLMQMFPQLAQATPQQKATYQQQAMQQMSREQTAEFENQVQSLPIFTVGGQVPHPSLSRRFDLYAIEIKSKTIAIFFKFFQREEHIVYKVAKKCLSRLLKKEANQQEALPNLILKECVRPSLNIISLRAQTPALYEQLTLLICVLHGCFNDQLGRHLIRCYESNRPRCQDEFRLIMNTPIQQPGEPPLIQGASDQQQPVAAPQQFPNVELMSELERQNNLSSDIERLVTQQNTRIQEIENSYHITKILYLLLPQNRPFIHQILLQIPDFETSILVDLDKKFEVTLRQIFDFYKIPFVITNVEQSIRPLAIKVGLLKSDLREGLLKFYNKNPFEAIEELKKQIQQAGGTEAKFKFYDLIIDILKEPASFCLRERFAKDLDIIKLFLSQNIDSKEFSIGIKIVEILQKYNPSILTLSHSCQLAYSMRPKWLQFSDFPDSKIDDLHQFQNQSLIRRSYKKLMKCMINYCRQPKSKINAIIDLAKGYRSHGLIDMTAVRLFFQFEVPYKFPLERAKELTQSVLEKIRNPTLLTPSTTMNIHEVNYQAFELILMPIITRYTNNEIMFRKLIDEKILNDFMDAIFGSNSVAPGKVSIRVDEIKSALDQSSFFSSEQFLIDVAKVLNLIFRYFDFYAILKSCHKDIIKVNSFLYTCAKKSKSPLLIEWSFYSLTSMFIRILNTIQTDNSHMNLIPMIDQTSDSILMMILQHSQNITFKALVHKSFRNLIQIIESINHIRGIQQSQRVVDIRRYESVPYCLKEALIYEGRQNQSLVYLSSFILANQDTIYRYDHKFNFIYRIHRIISRFAAQHTLSLPQKQLVVELSHVLIQWARNRFIDYTNDQPGSKEILHNYYTITQNIFYCLSKIFIVFLHTPNEPLRDTLELVPYAIKNIKQLVHIFPDIRPQFAFFQRLIANENAAGQGGTDSENLLQLTKLVLLNIFYIFAKYSARNESYKTEIFLMEILFPVSTKFQRGILFLCRITNDILNRGQESHEARLKINDFVKQAIQRDLEESISKNIDDIRKIVHQIEEKWTLDRRIPALSFQEQASHISQTVPHYAIRLIDFLERQQKQTGIIFRDTRGLILYENEFIFYKNLSMIIHKLISNFRRQIVFDQGEISPTRLKFKHGIPFMLNQATTQYTQPDLITLNDDILEVKVEEANADLFNKESILLGLLLIARKLKRLPNEEAVQLLENLTASIQFLLKYNLNEYIIEGVRRVIDVIILDQDDDLTKFLPEKKAEFIKIMVSKIGELQTNLERKDNNQPLTSNSQTQLLMEKLFEQAIQFLEMQTSLMHEYSIRLFEKLFIHSRGKAFQLKQRLFNVFERFNGPSLFKKLQFFFTKHLIDDTDKLDKLSFFSCQSQFLDFTLHSFKSNGPLRKLQCSSKLFALYNEDISLENLIIDEADDHPMLNTEYQRITSEIEPFKEQQQKYKGKRLSALMNSLSEIISMNPNYSQEKMISDKLLTFLFHQYWSTLLTREEQQYLAESVNKYFLSSISLLTVPVGNQPNAPGSNIDHKKYSFPRVFLEALAATSPQVRLEPEMLQLMGKTFNLWHVVIPIIENQMVLYPDNERYFFAMNELYEKLAEIDYIAGLRRFITKSPETRSMVSYAQHDMWEEINQQFSQYITYYAEQEGHYAQMDQDQRKLGKYQRQIPEYIFNQLKNNHERLAMSTVESKKQQNPIFDAETFMKMEREKLEKDIELASGQLKFENEQKFNFPRRGPNSRVQEIDLRIWENLFIDSLKVLSKWDNYYDITKALQTPSTQGAVEIPNNIEMLIEYAWNVKDWNILNKYITVLHRSDQIKHRLYYIYLIFKIGLTDQFESAFKNIVQLSYNKWDQQLPKYVDNVHFENMIMYQLIMEGSEGGRTLIKEAQQARMRNRVIDFKTVVNIWRERVPQLCESIQMWKEVLENRNFIQDQISSTMIPSQQIQNPNEQQIRQIDTIKRERQEFSNEFLDKPWNYQKLAYVSRKQKLPTLALSYLNQLSHQLQFTYDSEGTKHERFKFDYEYLKLQLDFNNSPDSLNRFVTYYQKHLEDNYISPQRVMTAHLQQMQGANDQNNNINLPPQPGLIFEQQQTAELQRLIGDYFFKIGKLDSSQKYLKDSLNLNKKESKTWMSFAKLNQTVFNLKKDEVSLQHTLKSYCSAITLSLHKSRYIIPLVLNLIKRRRELNGPEFKELSNSLRKNVDQMPTWIWLFWIPQILQMFYTHNNHVEISFTRVVLDKICKLYPQTIYYRIKNRQESYKTLNPQPTQEEIDYTTWFMKSVKQYAQQPTYHLDRISQEFMRSLKQTPEEEFQFILSKILCMSSFFKIENFESDFSSFLTQLKTRFFSPQNLLMSPLLSELQGIFERDFLNPVTREKDTVDIIKRLKNMKDYLQKRINLMEQRSYLELISPYLANFNEKGVELPGQFMISEQEPVPQNTIYIQKFDPQIFKGSGIGSKRITIKCCNQKQYAFSMSSISQMKDELAKFASEERLNQVKLIMNQIFKKHKETLKRSVKFYVPMKALLHRCKIVQDDTQFQSLQEIHDFLFHERGMDTDQALNLQIQKVIETYNYQEQQAVSAGKTVLPERAISSISAEKRKQINEETFQDMNQIYCKPYLLSSFFHRIFYSVDELFIFKKYFTTYHAANSFFSYVFHQVEFFTLTQLTVCKTTGQLAFNDAKLLEFLKSRNLKKYIQQANQQSLDFESLEQEDMSSPGYLPFRLSSNIVEFIGRAGGGLSGLFAGVMTSCSLAISKHHEKLMPLLHLVYRDDLNSDNENALHLITQCLEFMKFKMISLSQNKNVLNLDHFLKDDDYIKQHQMQAAAPDQLNDEDPSRYVKFGNYRVPREFLKYEVEKPNVLEEFNKKVFDLIEIAMDESRLSQMPSNWHAWF